MTLNKAVRCLVRAVRFALDTSEGSYEERRMVIVIALRVIALSVEADTENT